MKKILLSILMLCTAVRAWSQATYTTKEVILLFSDHDTSWKTTDIETNISVQATPFTTNKEAGNNWWKVGGNFSLGLFSPEGYVITGVKFTFISSNLASNSESIENCDCLVFDTTNETWKQNDGGLDYYSTIRFTSSSLAYVRSVKITYHKHTFAHNEVVTATCVATGTKESWTCSDCGRTYSDANGAKEVADADNLVLPIVPTNHSLQEHARVEATCIESGNVQYWHCNLCGKNFADEGCTSELSSDELVLPADPTNHASTLEKHEAVAATCVSTGSVLYWHCSDCNRCFSDEQGQTQISNDNVATDVNPKNHASTLTKHEAVAATCVSTGIMLYWHCSDCDHCFKDEAGATQIASDNVTTAIDPTNHGDKLKEVAFKNASVIEDGILHHWHCEACSNDYADADCTESMNGKTVKAKYDADALLVGNTTVDESYLFSSAKVTFDGDKAVLAIGSDSHQYDLSETDRLLIGFSHTFKLKANQDPDHTNYYYSTFYTSEGAYKVPADGSATAYAGTVESGEKTDVLKLADIGNIIHKEEPVILRASQSEIVLMPSCNKAAASTESILEGTDVEKKLETNQYALSLGQNGVGFYLWDGKKIGANKAYLTLDGVAHAKAFTFMFEDGTTTAIEQPTINGQQSGDAYNLNGIRVNDNYKGIVIKNGKKVYQK